MQEHDNEHPDLDPTDPSEEGEPAFGHHFQAGLRHYQQQELPLAMQEFDAALALRPNAPRPRLMRGIVLRELQRDGEAEEVLRGLIDDPDVASPALTNLSALARRREDYAQCEEYLRTAIAKGFQFAPAHFHLAMLLLERGDLREGFREYEWRWYTTHFTRFPCVQPRWDGRPLAGTLLVHTEQGTEDTIHFCRYLPLLRKNCQRLILVCAERMGDLLTAPEWSDEVYFPGELPARLFDSYLPLLSAPHVFQTELTSIPADIPYLRVPPRPVSLGNPRSEATRLRVAIAWAQGPADVQDASRYCSLAELAPLWNVPHVEFYSLQQGAPADEVGPLAASVPSLHDVAGLATDLADLAALVTQFDLVVTTDTTVAHLAGAMGVPTWNLLSRHCHWRWMRDREDSPWYPTMRLFRQRALHDWPALWRHVALELSKAVDDPSRLPPHYFRSTRPT